MIALAGCGKRHTDTEDVFQGLHRKNAPKANTYTIQKFAQKLDHFSAIDPRTFQQRYLIDSQYAKGPSSPVIYYVCGEGNCMDGELDPASAFVPALAKSVGAHLVALEHRYYGESQPFDLMTADTLKYLTVEQAIEDLATFQKWMVTTQLLSGKWIAIGGSYPASLAAIYRLEHPELAAGAIASSACAILTQGTIDSDKVAAETAGASCVAKYRTNVLMPIQLAIGNPAAMTPIKKVFDALDIVDDLDFLGVISGTSIFDVQINGSKDFCASLDKDQPLASFAEHLTGFVTKLGWGNGRMIAWSYTGALDAHSSLYETGFGFRQWIYQACTEEGVFSDGVMKANPDTNVSLSSTLTDALPEKYCDVFFGIKTPPIIDEMNEKYYKPLLDPSVSNILFINGSNDPACFPYAISQENGNATNPNTVAYTVKGGSHCQDLSFPDASDSASLKGARDLEIELASRWSN